MRAGGPLVIALVVAALASLVLFGLLHSYVGSIGGASFERVDAPHWEPGYEWTYESTWSEQRRQDNATGRDYDGGSGGQSVTYRVVNVSAPLAGEPVYHVRLDVSSPTLSDASFAYSQAFSQDDLEVVAFSTYPLGTGSQPACGPRTMFAIPDGYLDPVPSFPLAPGQERTGTVDTSILVDEEWQPYEKPFEIRVKGKERVVTPGGGLRRHRRGAAHAGRMDGRRGRGRVVDDHHVVV